MAMSLPWFKNRGQHKRRMTAWIVFLRHRTYAPSEWRTHPRMVLCEFTILLSNRERDRIDRTCVIPSTASIRQRRPVDHLI